MELLVKEKLSVRQACKWVKLPRSVFRYIKVSKNDSALMGAFEELIAKHPTIGFWKFYYRLRRKGYGYDQRLYRVFKLLKAQYSPQDQAEAPPQRIKKPLVALDTLNQAWSMDFMSDSLVDGRRFRLLNNIDDYNRESL